MNLSACVCIRDLPYLPYATCGDLGDKCIWDQNRRGETLPRASNSAACLLARPPLPALLVLTSGPSRCFLAPGAADWLLFMARCFFVSFPSLPLLMVLRGDKSRFSGRFPSRCFLTPGPGPDSDWMLFMTTPEARGSKLQALAQPFSVFFFFFRLARSMVVGETWAPTEHEQFVNALEKYKCRLLH